MIGGCLRRRDRVEVEVVLGVDVDACDHDQIKLQHPFFFVE
jgi:hypothetical protein